MTVPQRELVRAKLASRVYKMHSLCVSCNFFFLPRSFNRQTRPSSHNHHHTTLILTSIFITLSIISLTHRTFHSFNMNFLKVLSPHVVLLIIEKPCPNDIENLVFPCRALYNIGHATLQQHRLDKIKYTKVEWTFAGDSSHCLSNIILRP